MSRVGKLPISLPSGVKVETNGSTVTVEGSKGKLARQLPEGVEILVESDSLSVKSIEGVAKTTANQGLTRSLVASMVKGVSEGFERILEINGVGYRVAVQGRSLDFSLGYSHPVKYELPEGMSAEVDKQMNLTIKGIDKELIGSVAAKIRSFRGPEPYKGKGIKYAEERIVRKAGKTGK
ncbi:MAG: 50S ribosomal protein L6 [bacterium]|nr:50S ribosomal protein L6 [bacterium]